MHKGEEWFDLALEVWAEILVQVEDDPQADDGVLLIVRLEKLHAQREHLLHVRPQRLVVRQPIQHLEQHVADLVLGPLGELRTALGQQLAKGREEVPQEIDVLGGVHDFDGVARLGDENLALVYGCGHGARRLPRAGQHREGFVRRALR